MKTNKRKKKSKPRKRTVAKHMMLLSTVVSTKQKEFRKFNAGLTEQFKNQAKFALVRLYFTDSHRNYDIYVDKYSYHQIKYEMEKWISDFVSGSDSLSFT